MQTHNVAKSNILPPIHICKRHTRPTPSPRPFAVPYATGGDVAPTRTCRRRLYDLLEANNKAGMLLEAITVLLIVVNVVCFLLSTEESLADNTTAWRVFDSVELCTVSVM